MVWASRTVRKPVGFFLKSYSYLSSCHVTVELIVALWPSPWSKTHSCFLCIMKIQVTSFFNHIFSLQDVSSQTRNPSCISLEEYFDKNFDLEGRDIGRPIEQSTKTQKFKATLWLCEDFPLSLQEQVVPIIDLMAASNAHFRKLKDFITLQLPAGFPVKIGMYLSTQAYQKL